MNISLTLYATFSALDTLDTVDGKEYPKYPKEVIDIISNLAKDGWRICQDSRGDRAGIIHLVLTFTLEQ